MIKAVGIISLLLVAIIGACAMNGNVTGKVCLFSQISGTIKINGRPAANVRLVRTASLKKPNIDETVTDENGYFEFPAAYESVVTKLLPQEFVAKQDIDAHHGGKSYKIWDGIKRQPKESVEARGKPLIVECELESEEQLIAVNRGPIFSRCTWDVEPDPKLDMSNPFDESM